MALVLYVDGAGVVCERQTMKNIDILFQDVWRESNESVSKADQIRDITDINYNWLYAEEYRHVFLKISEGKAMQM